MSRILHRVERQGSGAAQGLVMAKRAKRPAEAPNHRTTSVSGIIRIDAPMLRPWRAKMINAAVARSEQQRKAGIGSHTDQRDEHDRWRKWQRQEIALDKTKTFERLSKIEQARRLKKNYNVVEDVQAIRKQLDPRPQAPREKSPVRSLGVPTSIRIQFVPRCKFKAALER